MLLGNTVQAPRKHVEFAGHRNLHDQPLALVNQVGITLRPPGKLAVQPLEEVRLGSVHEESVEQVEKAVAGGALDGPARPQFFVAHQNLFRGQVNTPPDTIGRAVRGCLPGQRGLGLQVLEIAQRVEQTVGVVDADSRHQRFLYQLERDAMNDAEYFRALHPDCGQVIDVEKSAIVDFVGGNAPETQAICLVIQDFLQSVKTVRVSLAAIDDGQYFLQTSAHDIAVLDQGSQTAANDLFLALAFTDFGQVSVFTQREMRDRGDEYSPVPGHSRPCRRVFL